MPTECSRDLFGYEVVEGRQVVAAFDGGEVTSDAGALLLGATDRAIGLVTGFAACFDDGRVQAQVEHTVAAMVAQRVFGIALGYEDLVDHDQLRHDPVLGPWPASSPRSARIARRSPAKARSTGSSTRPRAPSRYHRIGHDAAAIEGLFVALFLEAHKPPRRIILDLDATDDPLHGHQEGGSSTAITTATAICRSMSSAGGICSRPSCGARTSMPRPARSPRSNGSSARSGRAGPRSRSCSGQIRALLGTSSWRGARPIGSTIVFGLARNERLVGAVADELALARAESLAQAGPVRRFADFPWRTLDSWSCARRVIAKAEHLPKGPNPRFVVTSLRPARSTPAPSTRISTAPAAKSRTGSRNSSSTCSPIAPAPPPCVPTSSACGSRPSPTSCSRRSGGSGCGSPSSPTRLAAPSASSCSKSARRFA